MPDLLSRESLAHAIGGAFGGSVAYTIFYPLDQIRTASQLGHDTPDSVAAMFRGLRPALAALWCSNFVYFYANNAGKLYLVRVRPRPGGKVGVWEGLAVASLAGAVNVLTTLPLWVAATRLKMEKQSSGSSLLAMLSRVASEEGVGALWGGVGSSLALVSVPTVQHVTYDRLKLWLLGARRPTDGQAFVLASASKIVATLLTYPVQTAQTVLRARSKKRRAAPRVSLTTPPRTPAGRVSGEGKDADDDDDEEDLPTSTVAILRSLPVGQWYRGLRVKLAQTVLMSAFHIVFYERIFSFIVDIVLARRRRQKKRLLLRELVAAQRK